MTKLKFSANLGFLWVDRPLHDAIRAAAMAGFDAVECHWPYDVAAADVARALGETGLPLLGLNTSRGDPDLGENGLSALPGRADDARRAVDQALEYAGLVDAKCIHVMAGRASGMEARAAFLDTLEYACERAAAASRTILIEPLNRHDAPGYFLRTTDQAADLIAELGAPNLKLMFDCYHVGRTEGDLITRFRALRAIIGHVQFAGVPDRGPPDRGEIDYQTVLPELVRSGWDAPFGAEYRPGTATDQTLGWLERFRNAP